ncbi:MAG: hypothetical protein QW156_04775 [Candidatus Aenigmatarchaeota archaeon]
MNQNGKEEFDILSIVLIILLVILLVLAVFKFLTPRKKKETEIVETEIVEEGKNYIYLSELEDYLKDYALDPKDQFSFFKLREKIFEEGKQFVRSEIEKIVNSEKAFDEKIAELIHKFEEIEERPPKLKPPKWEKKDKNTPKIYYSAIYDYIKEIKIDTEHEKPRDVFYRVLNEIYWRGIQTALSNVKSDIQRLKMLSKSVDVNKSKRLLKLNDIIERLKKGVSDL